MAEGGGGRVPPQPTAGPPGPEPPGRPPRGRQGAVSGDQGPPPSPPPPGPRADGGRLERQQPGSPPGKPLHPGAGGTAAATSAGARQGPPVDRPHTPALPATDRQRNGAAHSEASLGKAGARTRARRSLPPSPPPPRRTDPLAADQAAPDADGRPATPTARVYLRGVRLRLRMTVRHPTGQGGCEQRSGPPSTPSRCPSGLRAAGARTLRPPAAQGTSPLPRGDRDAGEGTQRDPHAPRPAPPAACSRVGRGRRASPHQRAGATHRPRPGAARDDEPEKYGGRAPHDQSIASDYRNVAHSARAEGGFGSVGAPGGAVHGPPLPPPPARQAAPGARGGPATPTECREGDAPTMRGGQGREPQDAPKRKSRGAAARPPPHPPHRPTSRGGASPQPPEAEGMVPPPPGETAAPERGARARPAPPPQPPAPTGTAGNKRTRANAPGRHTDRAQRRQAGTNRSGMGGTPSMTRKKPVTPALLPAQGRQRDGTRQRDPPPDWPPGRTNGGHGAQAAPPNSHPTPRHANAPDAQTHSTGGAQPRGR